jgi:L-threonylcarbamoyladenylate synthase
MIVPASPPNIARAAERIRAGDVVAFPTETVYGLGADATDGTAVARVFEIKDRPSFDPLIVHVASLDEVGGLVRELPGEALVLGRRFWPGPLTLVLAKSARTPDLVTAGLPSVALRVPDHPVALELIRRARCPIAAPSANSFGRVSPTTAEHVFEQLGDRVPLILDGGPCQVGIESTVLSLLGSPPELLRPGGISLEEIEAAVGRVNVPSTGAERLSPGRSTRHYAPSTPLALVDSVAEIPRPGRERAALLVLAPTAGAEGFAHVERLSGDGDRRIAAANLFGALHRLDRVGYARIYAVRIDETGLGRAIMDRLRRAARKEEDAEHG